MVVALTQNIKIFPTRDQSSVLRILSNQCRLLYNFALAERKLAWYESKKSVTYEDQANKLKQLKKDYSEYGKVYSKVLQETLKTLDSSYRSFYNLSKKDSSARPPNYRGKKYFFTLKYNQSGFKCSNGQLRLSHKCNAVKLAFAIPDKFKFEKIKQVSISYQEGEWYASITHDMLEPEYIDNGKYQAMDLGITNIATAVNERGKFVQVKNKRFEKYWNPIIDMLKSRRDHCLNYSKRNKYLTKQILKFTKRMSNQLKDYQHKLSRQIVDNTRANTIVVGDLNVKRMAQSKAAKVMNALNYSTQNTGALSRFTQFLTYKASLAGKKLIKIDESYTSKMCCVCDKKHDMTLYDRVLVCDCGNVLDRDKNSAVNILKRYLSEKGVWTAHSTVVLSALRQTGVVDYKVEATYSQESSV